MLSRLSKTISFLVLFAFAPPGQAVDSPPDLIDFQVVASTVDTTNGGAVVSFSAQIVDSAFGVCERFCDDAGGPTQLQLLHPATGQRHSASFTSVAPNTYQASLLLPGTSAAGLWQVETLWLADISGNRRALTTPELADLGFATDIQNASTAGDAAPPTLGDISVDAIEFDASSGASLGVVVQAVDVGSGLCTGGCDAHGGASQVRFVHASSGQVRDGLLFQTGPDLYGASVPFPSGSAEGAWAVAALQLVDEAGNRAVFTQADLTAMNFDTQLTVTSSTSDVAPPSLVGSGFAPDPIDTTLSSETAAFGADALDDLTGVCTGACSDFGAPSQVRFQRDGSDHVRFGLLDIAAGVPQMGTFATDVSLPVSGNADVWRPTGLLLVDVAGNRVLVPEPSGLPAAAAALLTLSLLGVAGASGRQFREGKVPTSAMM